MPVREIKTTISDHRLADAIATDPEDIKKALGQWRTLKDYESEVMASLSEVKEKIAYLEKKISSHLTVPDDGNKSETISVPGAGSVWKERKVGVQVSDWEAWQKYCVRNGYGAALRQQTNVAPLQDMYEQIMSGELPMPKSVEFTTYEKPRFRRN